ncbi:hypothetical protein [Streptomyces griseus]|uniref:hypothetical protein n=1 Tax=Streptomyces griseus TaxID=1911 RepID=UPI0037B1B6A5
MTRCAGRRRAWPCGRRSGRWRRRGAGARDPRGTALPTAAAVGEFAPNPGELADRWAALLTEWRRIAAHLAATEADVYNTALDETGSTWAWEREERHARVLRERAAWAERQREKGDELHAELWLGAAAGRRVRAVAARAGLTPNEVLVQLAERVSVDDGGAVSVAPFTPGRAAGLSEER